MTDGDIRSLGFKLDRDYHIFKKPWFGYLMPIVNKHKGNFASAEKEIRAHIDGVLDKWYERIVYEAQVSVRRSDIKKALLERIEEDFFERGYSREQIALKELKKAFPAIQWTGEPSPEVENQGIDIIGVEKNGYTIGISVKGWSFDILGDYKAHKSKLIDAPYTQKGIVFVEEHTRQLRYEEVKNG